MTNIFQRIVWKTVMFRLIEKKKSPRKSIAVLNQK